MSLHAIHLYYSEVEKLKHYGGTNKETAIRNAFYHLLNEYAKQKGLMIVPEVTIKAANGRNVTPDGTLKDTLRQDWGYWESKDEADKIDDEIAKKFGKGYPNDNILFEDSNTAVLIQNGFEGMRVSMKDAEALDRLLNAFMSYERPEVGNFRKAIELFKQDIPKVTETIRAIILSEEKTNTKFKAARSKFLKLCHDSINPDIVIEDVNEMIIQHILTEDIFNTIFDETQFHRENNIARELEKVIHTFFSGQTRRIALSSIQHYYQTINAAAAGIADHHEKQRFLKVVYETFYKSYNPKAADRLGVVYTPNEIVRFMVESTDYLLHKHFNKYLEDKNVEILDPATGTGTFICDIIDHIRKEKLEYKYKNELHANEVAILPYYISNLNIEFTYAQKMKTYAEFENLCFVDTLDNMGFGFAGKQLDMFAPLTEENSKRIRKQNGRKIAVIIGNPPYNANQLNENDNNKNREYPEIDKRIKETFIHYSTAQKTKVYDMYARFYRWAFDRLDSNGVVAFVTNRSFIDSRTFDGFRKTIQQEFDNAYIVDTQSDVRANPKLSGTKHNVFGIQTGVAIMFLIKKAKRENKTCKIHYIALNDFWRKEQKLEWLAENPLRKIPFEIVRPDKNNNWINLAENDWEKLLPLADKNVKSGKSEKALFKMFSLGVVTARDEWVYDDDPNKLKDKVKFLIDCYNKDLLKHTGKEKNRIKDLVDYAIKWTRAVKNDISKGRKYEFDETLITDTLYRPFVKKSLYFCKELNEMQYQLPALFAEKNLSINFLCVNSSNELATLVSDQIFDYCLLKKGNGGTQSVPIFHYNQKGEKVANITDWGYEQFKKHYYTSKAKKLTKKERAAMTDDELADWGMGAGEIDLSKEMIFHYVYAVLHNPAYREKYALNLKREFPRIPFYKDFHQWASWGYELMRLHLHYEDANAYPLERIETQPVLPSLEALEAFKKPKLKADKTNGQIVIDGFTTLSGIPAAAWEYKLGNRSALEWVLDQYKESKPKDPTIAEKFNTYKFADYKEHVIDLLTKVCTVSVETMNIVEAMKAANE